MPSSTFPTIATQSQDCTNALRKKDNTNVVYLGDVSHGTSRHRSLLFKFLADHLGIPSILVKHNLMSHYYNRIALHGRLYLVDVLHSNSIFEEGTEPALRYLNTNAVSYESYALDPPPFRQPETPSSSARYIKPIELNTAQLEQVDFF
jgi:hypothetical protein